MSLKMRILFAGANVYWRLFKPLTLGVKVMLIRNKSILLVKHSYEPGWHLPGGGVKKMEPLETAVRREAREELGANLGAIHLFGIYSNVSQHKNDHITVTVCHDFSLDGKKDIEIEAYDFYPLNDLPIEATSGTQQRVAEYLAQDHQAKMGLWQTEEFDNE